MCVRNWEMKKRKEGKIGGKETQYEKKQCKKNISQSWM